ncbi:transcellular chaperone signaling (x)cross tissue [Caenorhabditis elegans]|uniref:Uncharacterized protein txt-18 n=1 Tax=Caenorhabditis elegans TaxID=6239 RepID=YQD1_CAEEL|nr:transcellular chaperone signaling (x)cross tissue [Caenorhabditis elegans]Q09262.3 RecName: Full=Uncharacterized protein C32D5.1 [Caenorhabditis elegans]CCD66027.1 transcellular chaperone signaling (x)cross tissue [Caenorhabditis elegans]|eukprot:NP_495276.2 Uncharacterized protein CELE_C32D5.1 [Caenorhabditis elegans]
MEKFIDLLEFGSAEQKRKMGRPSKIPPFSHYDAYRRSDIDFFISLFSGREELYSPCKKNSDFRQKAFYIIEKKCGHFLAMRKGRNAEKLWLYLFNDFEKMIRNGGDKNDEKSKSIVPFYDCLQFLIPYLEKTDSLSKLTLTTCNAEADDQQVKAKKPKIEHELSEDKLNDDWLQKVIDTVTCQQSTSCTSIQLNSSAPSTCSAKTPNSTANLPTSEKHADIIAYVTNFLEDVPNDKLMLHKVRLFQFIEEEKSRLKEESK